MVYTSFWLCFGASGDTWYTSFLLGILGILGILRFGSVLEPPAVHFVPFGNTCCTLFLLGLHWGILGILRFFGGLICHTWYILCFGSVLKPPGILGILRSFWVYLVYLGLHLVYLVYTLRVILGRTSSQKEIIGIL